MTAAYLGASAVVKLFRRERETRALVAELSSHSTWVIRQRAGEAFFPKLGALDAVHAATVLALGDRIDAIFVYDHDLRQAVAGEGLAAASPGHPAN